MIQFHIERGIPLPPLRGIAPHERGSCHCGRRPRPGFRTCDKCLAAVRRAYKDQRSRGLCGSGRCANKPQRGHSMCEKHLQQLLANNRKLYSKRSRRGLCRCGKQPRMFGDAALCVMCRDRAGRDPLPQKMRAVVRQFWRLDRIDQRRTLAENILQYIRKERTREIISLRHGLLDGIDHTLEETGERFGITRERVRQIESKVYRTLAKTGIDVSPLTRPSDIQRAPTRQRKVSKHEQRKAKCHALVSEAIRDGKLTKQPCQECNSPDAIAHHPDYSKPLLVQWLCRRHHAVAHGKKIRPETKNPRYDGPVWLFKAAPEASDERYAASEIRAEFLRHSLGMNDVGAATGIGNFHLRKIVRGEDVKMSVLAKLLRYVEHLKNQVPQIAI